MYCNQFCDALIVLSRRDEVPIVLEAERYSVICKITCIHNVFSLHVFKKNTQEKLICCCRSNTSHIYTGFN